MHIKTSGFRATYFEAVYPITANTFPGNQDEVSFTFNRTEDFFSDTRYNWKVKYCTVTNVCGVWSETYQFYIINNTTPRNASVTELSSSSTGKTYEFRWDKITSATRYDLIIRDETTGNITEYYASPADYPSRSLTLENGNYAWAVRAEGIKYEYVTGDPEPVTGEQTSFENLVVSATGSYPNPFNPTTTFTFALNRPEQVSITVYNTLGRQIDTILLNEPLRTGVHSMSWNASQYPSGMYLIRLQYSGFVENHRVTLIK